MPSMNELVALIGKSIMDTDVQDLLANVRIIASIDEDLEEGEIPRRWLQSERDGFDIEHQENGRITTIFLFVGGDEQHRPFNGSLADGLSTTSDQNQVWAVLGTPAWSRRGVNDPVLGTYGPADRYDRDSKSVHFEYDADSMRIKLVTAMHSAAVPR